MSVTKNALIRYKTLDQCFRNPGKRYFIEDLLKACNNSLYEFEPNSNGIKKRQLYEDIRYMESPQGYSIPLKKNKIGRNVYYNYSDFDFSINNEPINESEVEQLKSAMLVLSRFKGLPQFEWVNELLPKLDNSFNLTDQPQEIISFDSNEFLKGVEFITPLYNSIIYHQTLEILYKSFKSDEAQIVVFHPYHLKQYNNRWFIFGKNGDYENLTNLALDRIKSLKVGKEMYIPNTKINFDEYFEDIIGVSKLKNQDLIKIIFNASTSVSPYIKTKPLHGSQRKIGEDKNGYIFSIEVIPNFELEKMILSFGEDLTVIKPDEFRHRIMSRLVSNLDNY
ncbi:helix-turn-helix transcriptional regulator [Polaribacter sp. 11A2H]|uniref:helix-turn-helix transcriptional regulator n=1 Tax=Polaribacter sp. 11A2H TaxID=2687290 RepID=UPI00140B8DB1|nr:WYL domain-containing protein [Polaribacter sp. 11A2H]